MRNLNRSRKARGGRREKRRSSGFAELRVSPPDSPIHARADPFGMHTPSGAEVLRVGVIKDLSSQGRVIAEEAYNAEWEPGSPVPLAALLGAGSAGSSPAGRFTGGTCPPSCLT